MDYRYRGYTEDDLAAMRSLVPNKRELFFNKQALDRVIKWFNLNYPDTPMEMLHHLVTPSQGDKIWVAFAMSTNARPSTQPFK